MSMQVIQHYEVTNPSGEASITFSSIPQTYTDLMIMASSRINEVNATGEAIYITLNGSTANFSNRYLQGDGSSASSGTLTRYAATQPALQATSNVFGNASIYIPNYRSSSAKSISSDSTMENNATLSFQAIHANLWNVTDAITSVTLVAGTGDAFLQYSSFTLYGIRSYNTTSSPKATGGIISYVNGYWVHTFTASGTFTPTENLTAEYLVIAGGGGGGANVGGGGGAGGYRSSVTGENSGGGASAESALSLTASTGYTVTVGAGGVGNANNKGTSGSNSIFSSVTSTGGGGGGFGSGTLSSRQGIVGGSGGGSSGAGVSGTTAGVSGTVNQGYASGSGSSDYSTYASAGGGGGSGAVGANGSTTNNGASGAGGAGVASSITGTSLNRAAGGGGGGGDGNTQLGAGGTGGGGNGGNDNTATSPTAGAVNTGSGGGGGGQVQSGAAGGSGVVIVRYAA